MISKICLGTVQFGMPYGISNKSGKASQIDVTSTMQYAYENGITMLDSAPSYGNSEEVIGKTIGEGNWDIITKTPGFTTKEIKNKHLENLVYTFNKSIEKIGRSSLYGLMIHACDDLLKPGGSLLLQKMDDLKSAGLVKKIGVSLYNSEQIDFILDRFDIDLVQLPFNILDQNLYTGNWIKKIKNHNIEIHARSALLQGLLLMSANSIPSYFTPVKKKLDIFYKASKELSLSRLELALGFVMNIDEIDKIVIGVNNVNQLREVVQAAQIEINSSDLKSLSIDDQNYTNPSLWKI